MGLDGGTIITRNDVLRRSCDGLNRSDTSRSTRGGAVSGVYKRRKLDDHTSKVTRWTTCALSGQPLAAPIVACFLGRLYSKAAVLEWLLARAGHFAEEGDAHRYINQLREAGDAFDHITSIKDVFSLQYTPATDDMPAVATATAGGGADPVLPAPYTCPITQLRCDRFPFVALVPCGHVLSERALKEAGRDGTCPTCGRPFVVADDVVPLLPTEEQLEELRAKLPARRKQQQKRQKKQRRRQRDEQEQQGQEGRESPSSQLHQQLDGRGAAGPAAGEGNQRQNAAAAAAAASGTGQGAAAHTVAGAAVA